MLNRDIKAVFWDFGGVITGSPFDNFLRYERANGLPENFIRGVNSHNPEANAWAKMERSEVDGAEFDQLFAMESEALGHRVPGAAVLALLACDVRPEMVEALRRLKREFKIACLTNNVRSGHGPGMSRSPAQIDAVAAAMALFDEVVESSKAGVRKPEPGFYKIACDALDITPEQVVFLDDLGINLKPARAMGMQTIKVLSADQALRDLEAIIGMDLR